MASAANLQTALDQISQLIVDVTASPKPDYSIDGVSYSWGSYLSMLLDKQQTLLQLIQQVSGPYEVFSG